MSYSLGSNSVFSPGLLARSLTPRLMKSRKRFESVGSTHSCQLPSTTDSEDCASPMWEDEQVCVSITVEGFLVHGTLIITILSA